MEYISEIAQNANYKLLSRLQHDDNNLKTSLITTIISDNCKLVSEGNKMRYVTNDMNVQLRPTDKNESEVRKSEYFRMKYVNQLCDVIPNYYRMHGYIKAGPIPLNIPDKSLYIMEEYIPNTITLEEHMRSTPNASSLMLQVILAMKMAYERYGIVYERVNTYNINVETVNAQDITYTFNDRTHIRLRTNRVAMITDYTINNDIDLLTSCTTFLNSCTRLVKGHFLSTFLDDVLQSTSVDEIISKFVDYSYIPMANRIRERSYSPLELSISPLEYMYLTDTIGLYNTDQLKSIVDNDIYDIDRSKVNICVIEDLIKLVVRKKIYNKLHKMNPIIPYKFVSSDIKMIKELCKQIAINTDIPVVKTIVERVSVMQLDIYYD
jgi:hypothetical protein